MDYFSPLLLGSSLQLPLRTPPQLESLLHPEMNLDQVNQVILGSATFNPATIFHTLLVHFKFPISPKAFDSLLSRSADCSSDVYLWLTCYTAPEIDEVIAILLRANIPIPKGAVHIALQGCCSCSTLNAMIAFRAPLDEMAYAYAVDCQSPGDAIRLLTRRGVIPTQVAAANMLERIQCWELDATLTDACLLVIGLLPEADERLLSFVRMLHVPTRCIEAIEKKVVFFQATLNQESPQTAIDLLYYAAPEEMGPSFNAAFSTLLFKTSKTTTELLHMAIDAKLPPGLLTEIVSRGAVPNLATYVKFELQNRHPPFPIDLESRSSFILMCLQLMRETPQDALLEIIKEERGTTEMLTIATDLGFSPKVCHALIKRGAKVDRSILRAHPHLKLKTKGKK